MMGTVTNALPAAPSSSPLMRTPTAPPASAARASAAMTCRLCSGWPSRAWQDTINPPARRSSTLRSTSLMSDIASPGDAPVLLPAKRRPENNGALCLDHGSSCRVGVLLGEIADQGDEDGTEDKGEEPVELGGHMLAEIANLHSNGTDLRSNGTESGAELAPQLAPQLAQLVSYGPKFTGKPLLECPETLIDLSVSAFQPRHS